MIKLEGILFDDYTIYDDEQPTRWTQVCKKHAKHFEGTDATLSDCPGEPTCGVAGCTHTAEFYVDFIDCEWEDSKDNSTEDEDEQEDNERHEERERDLMAYYRER